MSSERGEGDGQSWTTRGNWAQRTDAELVAGMQGGDPSALDEFIVRFGRLLFDRARRLGIRRCQSEDVITRVIEAVGRRLAAGEIQIRNLDSGLRGALLSA